MTPRIIVPGGTRVRATKLHMSGVEHKGGICVSDIVQFSNKWFKYSSLYDIHTRRKKSKGIALDFFTPLLLQLRP